MLASFTFANARSFPDRQTLSLVAHAPHKEIQGALIKASASGSDGPLLAAAAIYGPNASGKTNVLKALDYFRDAVVLSLQHWAPSGGTLNIPHARQFRMPSVYEIECVIEGVRYRYGFMQDIKEFHEEWLYAYPKKRERLLFHRYSADVGSDPSSINFGENLSGSDRDHQSFRRRTRTNSLFLSVAAQENQAECSLIYKWFYSSLNIHISPMDGDDNGFTSRLLNKSSENSPLIKSIILSADSSLTDIQVSESDREVAVDDDWAEDMPENLRDFVAENRKYEVSFGFGDGADRFVLPLSMQSEGLKKVYALSSTVACVLHFGEVLVVDELESSLHPHIASQLVDLFQNKTTNPNGAQLIFTTHDVGLLSDDHLRRDQVWFVEKERGNSALYSLVDFKTRKDENVQSGYLRGRFGAVPSRSVGAAFLSSMLSHDPSPR
ncbi:AAA family ATPase [Brevundimonas subvibrioides]|uniref:ATPase AAA-type core domain-containing protein n=1 Tax=Brevundimonas subvibrioides (strain ATCC 15264 / DSM 4735 / LMG 14903 / NBRC 16000 / CB 81) TaxID=633149 RepID=D9QN62_BRESC|nr:ATP-binding protein [Brevundimonas subvibrioides]ADL00263.1 conserved hypothetical protein [Brevundimonas subvibrioides ATCC 15264]